MSSQMIENIALTCILVAAKFNLETEDVVVNTDIARAMKLGNNKIDGLQKLNAMEAKMLEILDFELFVSIKDFNKV